jgi:predicted ATPase
MLVGASAAGKTTILRVISQFILAISMGHSVKEHCSIRMSFSIEDRLSGGKKLKEYLWELRTKEENVFATEDSSACPICYEVLHELQEKKDIIRRQDNRINIDGYENLPQVPKLQSAIYIFRENAPFKAIVDDMRGAMTLYNQNVAFNPVSTELLEQIKKIIQDARKNERPIRWHYAVQNKFPISLLIYIVKNTLQERYDDFLEDLQEIFPEIEEVHINQIASDDGKYYLSIRQNGNLILQPDISSGIMRTIYVLSCIHFCESNALIMFDELENSLGVNCLDEVVERIRQQSIEKNVQFMLTSHHPYIINQIPVKSWLIVSQKDGVIESRRAEELGLGKMQRERFFELINFLKRQSA